MSTKQAIIIGIIQGLTEFIPISSTAHLTLAGKLMGLVDPRSPERWTAFMAVVQLGTLVAVISYFASDLIKIARSFSAFHFGLLLRRPVAGADRDRAKLGWLIIIGTLPISVVGLLLRRLVEGELTKDLRVIAGSLILLALALALAEIIGRRNRGIDQVNVFDALIVGVAQVFALVPGSSRSGVTIAGGLFAGLRREAAARFSFLLSVPAIAASGLLELPKALSSVGSGWAPVAVATAASAVFGYLSIAFLLKYLQAHTTLPFIVYRIALGLLIIALLAYGRVSAL
jgi:undecaprenyl-diphosphatase